MIRRHGVGLVGRWRRGVGQTIEDARRRVRFEPDGSFEITFGMVVSVFLTMRPRLIQLFDLQVNEVLQL